jgi:hypothetical protein
MDGGRVQSKEKNEETGSRWVEEGAGQFLCVLN